MSSRRARAVDTAADGTFELSGLLAGTYLIVAVDATASIELQRPADIEALARVATPVTLADREQKHVTLTVSRLR
jgi:hypothetical protein